MKFPSPTTLEVLEASRVAWFATLRRAGAPHLTPVWFVFSNEQFWIGTAAANVKVKNVQASPEVSLAIDGTGTLPVVAEGIATIEARFSVHPDVVELFRLKYHGWDVSDESVDGPRVLLRITVVRFLFGV